MGHQLPFVIAVALSARCLATEHFPLFIHFDGEYELFYNRTASACAAVDTTDSMPIAWHSVVQNTTYFIAADGRGIFSSTGPDLEHLTHDCADLIFNSTFALEPESFANYQWIQSVKIFPNDTAYALIHNEFHGFNEVELGYCSGNSSQNCALWSTGLGISFNGGKKFSLIAEPPEHLVAAMPYTYFKDQGTSGYGAISTMIQGEDDAWYGFVNVLGQWGQPSGNCPFRATNLQDPASFRGHDGVGFNVRWQNPYRSSNNTRAICMPLPEGLGEGHPCPRRFYGFDSARHPSYILLGLPTATSINYAFGFDSNFANVVTNWSNVTELDLEVDRYISRQGRALYPVLLDSQAPSLERGIPGANYETVSNQSTYLYVNLERNIWRRKVVFSELPPIPKPAPSNATIDPTTCVAITVTGAGDASCNGVYSRSHDTSDDIVVFVKDSSHQLYRFQGIWRIAYRNVGVYYDAELINATQVPQYNWRIVQAIPPAPLELTCATL